MAAKEEKVANMKEEIVSKSRKVEEQTKLITTHAIKLRKSKVNIAQLKIGKEWEGIMKRKESGYPVKEEDTHGERRGSLYRVTFFNWSSPENVSRMPPAPLLF